MNTKPCRTEGALRVHSTRHIITLQVSVQLADDSKATIKEAETFLADRLGARHVRCVYPEGMRVLTTAASSVMTSHTTTVVK